MAEQNANRTPTRASLRSLIEQVLRLDSELTAFCLDYFPAVNQRFTDGMDRMKKVNLLFEMAQTDRILFHLRESNPTEVADNAALLRYQDETAPTPPTPHFKMAPATGIPLRLRESNPTEVADKAALPRYQDETAPPPSTTHLSPQPPGGAYTAAWYAHRERAERDALSYLGTPGKPTILWGPELFGKTWMLQHLLDTVRADCRIVRLSLDAFEDASRHSYELFLRELASSIAEDLERGEEWLNTAWEQSRVRGPNRRLSVILRQLLADRPEPLVLAIDRADAILSCNFRDDFFGLLRSWAEDTREPWPRLRLLLAISATPMRLTENPCNSPFSGLSDAIELGELDAAQIQHLAERYRLPWDGTADLPRLLGLVGGHPYLIRLVMHDAALHGTRLEDLCADAHAPRLFERHLVRCRRLLSVEPTMLAALRRSARDAQAPIEPKTYEQLHRLGFLVRTLSGGHRLRCKLYERLLD